MILCSVEIGRKYTLYALYSLVLRVESTCTSCALSDRLVHDGERCGRVLVESVRFEAGFSPALSNYSPPCIRYYTVPCVSAKLLVRREQIDISENPLLPSTIEA